MTLEIEEAHEGLVEAGEVAAVALGERETYQTAGQDRRAVEHAETGDAQLLGRRGGATLVVERFAALQERVVERIRLLRFERGLPRGEHQGEGRGTQDQAARARASH